MYRTRFQRLRRQKEDLLVRRLILILGAILIFSIGFFIWGIPFLVSVTEFIGSFGRADELLPIAEEVPLFPPRIDTLPTATNAATLPIRGFGQAGTTANLSQTTDAGEMHDDAQTLVAKDGTFTFPDRTLVVGENHFTAFLTVDEKRGPSSPKGTVLYDQTPPPLRLQEPSDGTRRGADERKVSVLGSTEAGANIRVNDHWIVVDPDGSFEATVSLERGENIIRVVATDIAGNSTSSIRTIQFDPGPDDDS